MKFIGHLDIMRYFQKAMRRAEIPIAFSQGFSPHMIMSFANPLGVGLTSEGEYFDIELKEPIATLDAVKRLNAVMVDGMEIVSFVELDEKQKTGMAIVAGADYLGTPLNDDNHLINEESIATFLSQETIDIVKKTKKSTREVDIRPMIYEMRVTDGSVFMKLATGSVENLKPDLVMDAFKTFMKVEIDSVKFQYCRLEVYAWDTDHTNLVTLDSLGHDIVV